MKTHWLYGMGPNKEIEFNVEVDEETDCTTCIHRPVCARDYSRICSNFTWSNSGHTDCNSCIHRFSRYDKDKVPCFHCKFYLKGDQNVNPR